MARSRRAKEESSEFRQMDIATLEDRLAQAKKELWEISFELGKRQLRDTSLVKKQRQTVARIETFIVEHTKNEHIDNKVFKSVKSSSHRQLEEGKMRSNLQTRFKQELDIDSNLASFLMEHLPPTKEVQTKDFLPDLKRTIPPLRILVKTDAAMKRWFSTPDWNLGDVTPLEIIRQGKGKFVADMLEDRLAGQHS